MGDVVLQHLLGELPDMWKYEDLASLAPVALSEHIAAALDFLERGLDTTKVRTPPAAIEFAGRLAEHGVPTTSMLSTGSRDGTYRACQREHVSAAFSDRWVTSVPVRADASVPRAA